ncbi:coiled-coil domain-containing protein 12 isoform X2 [Cavia porcellus]|uniref:coiled-coil domain-containing protein 12 isoform X2 n=1 Tax=Cavia porcellus TaxID=10141 RepID=UPI002FE3E59C
MAATAPGVGRLEEEALRRKERLKALREKTGRKDKEDGEPKTKQLRDEEEEGEKHRELRLRNYVPEDEDLKRRRVPQAKPVADQRKDQKGLRSRPGLRTRKAGGARGLVPGAPVSDSMETLSVHSAGTGRSPVAPD